MSSPASGSELIKLSPAARLSRLPAYIFVRLDELKAEARKNGKDLIDLGLGNPDAPTPSPVVNALRDAVSEPAFHGYPPFDGIPEFKAAIAGWMKRRYQVELEPAREILPLAGSKEGLAHLAMAYLDHGDLALIPSPCYPVHQRGPVLAGASIFSLPLTAENGFVPDLEAIPAEVAAAAKLLIINYPNNPTGATVNGDVLERAVHFCRQHQILLVHDFAYGEIYFEPERPHSLLEFSGAKEIGIEFHTLSKAFNMAGWRVGFAAGNETVIKTLYALKTNIDYGVFAAIQTAAMAALSLPDTEIETIRNTYRQRRDLLVSGLKAMGWRVNPPQAGMYVWLALPRSLGMSSSEFCEHLLNETGVVVTPGIAFGDGGEGYVRISLVAPVERLREALRRWQSSRLKP
jgi:LL-diaminopimelate aminotransferase